MISSNNSFSLILSINSFFTESNSSDEDLLPSIKDSLKFLNFVSKLWIDVFTADNLVLILKYFGLLITWLSFEFSD